MRLFSILLVSTLFMNCSPKQKPIAYGENQCNYCKMTIVDKIHGAELVTTKGKVYTYDAIECMTAALKKETKSEMAFILVNHYESPEQLIDAKEAIYLFSKELPSPMGGFLTAFKTQDAAQKALQQYDGELYSWEQLIEKYK